MIELPKDAEGREIPLDTKVLYNEDGKCFKVNRFTYSVVQTMPGLKWGVVFMDCLYDYCSSFYLTPPETPDGWEKLEEDLDRAVENGDAGDESIFQSMACAYMNRDGEMCGDCKFWNKYVRNCTNQMLEDVVSRIRKLRGEN